MLESLLKPDNAFLTLTYSDKCLPRMKSTSSSGEDCLATLDPLHLQNWLKRFRKAIEPLRIRYYAVGEYGDETFRPHYHVAVFGWPACYRGRSDFRPGRIGCCFACDVVAETWTDGNIMSGKLEVGSAQYLAGYVTKKMTRNDDVRLAGRQPEFARMSLRPGIGFDAMHDVASVLMALGLDESEADVPSALRHGSRTLPLGRYLQRSLRMLIGKEPNAPEASIQAAFERVRPLFEAASAAPTSEGRTLAFKNALIDADDQRVVNAEVRRQIYGKRRQL